MRAGTGVRALLDVADQTVRGESRRRRLSTPSAESLGSPDVAVWHSGDAQDNDRSRALKVIKWFIRTTTHRSYEILDRQVFDGGFVQQHVLRADGTNGSSIVLRVCIVIKVVDGLITRIDEYFDIFATVRVERSLSVAYGMMRFVTADALMLLDTASLYFRAYFGVPDSVRAPDGTPVNAVRGLLDFIDRLVQDHRPDDLVACMDADWRPQWRVDLIPSYKAHRVAEEARDRPGRGGDAGHPLAAGAGHRGRAGRARHRPRGRRGYEADDVIGTLTGRATGPVDIVTGDRDLYQLVDDAARGARAVPAQGRRHAPAHRRGVAAREVRRRRRRATRIWRCCAATRATACPACRASARRRRPSCSTSSATWPASSPRSTTRRRSSPRRSASGSTSRGPTWRWRPTVVKVAGDVPLPEFDPALPARRATPRRSTNSPRAGAWVDRCTGCLSRSALSGSAFEG